MLPSTPIAKAGEERSFLTVETNFIPGRTFQSLEDLNRQALEWSTVRMEQRPQGKAGLIPAQAFEHERTFLTPLPRHLPAPYLLLERTVDEYGYVAVDGNYYEVPGSGRGKIQVLRYLHHLVLCQDRRTLIEYALPPWGVKNQPFHAPGQKPRYRPRNRKLSSQEEEKRLRAIDPVIGAYVDFILGTPGLLRHQFLRRLWAFHQRWSTALVPAHHRAGSPLSHHQPGDARTHRAAAPGRHRDCPIPWSIPIWKSAPPIRRAPSPTLPISLRYDE